MKRCQKWPRELFAWTAADRQQCRRFDQRKNQAEKNTRPRPPGIEQRKANPLMLGLYSGGVNEVSPLVRCGFPQETPHYAVNPFVSAMKAVSRFISSSFNSVSLWPAANSRPAKSL